MNILIDKQLKVVKNSFDYFGLKRSVFFYMEVHVQV